MNTQALFAATAVIALLTLTGCGSPSETGIPFPTKGLDQRDNVKRLAPEIEITERELEVIRFVLHRRAEHHPGDRIYFLTSSPMSNWGETGNWKSLSNDFHDSIKDLDTKYKPANEASYSDGYVTEKSTGKSGWMEWITIKRWISPTEVEVESGVWTSPLGGGAWTVIYEKIDGEWKFKKSLESWVS